MRTTRVRKSSQPPAAAVSARAMPSLAMAGAERRSGPGRTLIALGILLASFGAAAYGVLVAASSLAG